MSKLNKALDLLGAYIALDDDEHRIIHDPKAGKVFYNAQQELLELQRLQSTVKEFIANEGFQCRDDIYDACEEQNCPVDFIESLCDIVGYSE